MSVLISFLSYSRISEFAGLKFNSKNVEHFKRTSVAIFNDSPVNINNSISLSFGISFWSLEYFGTIWRIENNQKEFSRLVFNQHKDPDYYYLQLFIDQQPEPVEISLLRKDLTRNFWLQIQIDFNLDADSVLFSINNNSTVSRRLNIPDNLKSTVYFGLKNLDDINDYDLPGFYLRNLKISIDNDKHYHWEFNPSDADRIYDKINNTKVNLVNEAWLIKDHYEWELINSLSVAGSPLFAYDSIRSRVFIDLKDKLMIYDLLTNKDTTVLYSNIRPGQFSELIYNHYTDQLYSTFVGGGQVSVFDFSKLYWTSIDTTNELNGHYYGSVRFINALDSALYMFGGYGWYTAKNNFFKYDFIENKWKEDTFDGEIPPRIYSSVGPGFKPGEFLLFGGNGNKDGNQAKGFRNYFDLYSLDLNKRTISQYWSDIDGMEQYKSISNFPYLFLIPGDSSFYFLRLYSVKENLYWDMHYTQINKKKIVNFGADISIGKEGKNKSDYFCFNSKTNEFIHLNYDSDFMRINIYSLRYPPVEKADFILPEDEKENEQFPFLWILLALSGLTILILVFNSISKRKNENQVSENSYSSNLSVRERRNFIQLFGGLKILDSEGADVYQSISPKLKSIFLLILISSIKNHRSGITSEELSAIIWPDSSPENVKSSRGVAVNKLRKLLSGVDGVEITFNDRQWSLNFNNGAGCDYLEFLKIKNSITNRETTGTEFLNELFDVVDSGEFLKGISYEWLDAFKLAVNNDIIGFLKSILGNVKNSSDNNLNLVIRICDLVLKFDSVDEEAFTLKIRTHYKAGNHQLAKSSYNIFVAEYKHLYDEDYPLSFQEIISS
ncbi:MAG: hypothetical protein R6W68_16720 [Ignavibacteriaceae bacterium]